MAATSSGLTVNKPAKKWLTENDAETIFNRLEEHGKTWKIYVAEPMQFSATAIIHYQRLKDRLATHFVPFAQFEADAANGTLPDFSFIEPSLGHWSRRLPPCRRAGDGTRRGDTRYRPTVVGSRRRGVLLPDLQGLSGNAVLDRSNVWNTALLIGWHEPGGTYDHVPRPRQSPRPIRRHRRPSAASPSTARAIGSRPSSSPHGSLRERCSTKSTATLR